MAGPYMVTYGFPAKKSAEMGFRWFHAEGWGVVLAADEDDARDLLSAWPDTRELPLEPIGKPSDVYPGLMEP